MPRGGSRIGAGRKRGSKTARTADIAIKAAEAGITPVEYMVAIMRDETQPQTIRLQAAGMAAPYVHPRLANIQVERKGNPDILKKLWENMQAQKQLMNAEAPPMPLVIDNQPLVFQQQ